MDRTEILEWSKVFGQKPDMPFNKNEGFNTVYGNVKFEKILDFDMNVKFD